MLTVVLPEPYRSVNLLDVPLEKAMSIVGRACPEDREELLKAMWPEQTKFVSIDDTRVPHVLEPGPVVFHENKRDDVVHIPKEDLIHRLAQDVVTCIAVFVQLRTAYAECTSAIMSAVADTNFHSWLRTRKPVLADVECTLRFYRDAAELGEQVRKWQAEADAHEEWFAQNPLRAC